MNYSWLFSLFPQHINRPGLFNAKTILEDEQRDQSSISQILRWIFFSQFALPIYNFWVHMFES